MRFVPAKPKTGTQNERDQGTEIPDRISLPDPVILCRCAGTVAEGVSNGYNCCKNAEKKDNLAVHPIVEDRGLARP